MLSILPKDGTMLRHKESRDTYKLHVRVIECACGRQFIASGGIGATH